MALGLWTAGLLSACLPNPQSVKERRDGFDREGLRGSLILDAPPANMVRVDAEFGHRAKLLGYTMSPEHPGSGERVDIKLYWTVLAPVAEDYQVFVHGDAINSNAARLHGDHYPADGQYPMDVWREGEVVVDPFSMRIPVNYGAEALGIYLGLYLGNYRVPLTNRGSAEADNENRSRAILMQLK